VIDAQISALIRAPVELTVVRAPETEGGIPALPGLYAWWVKAGALPVVPPMPHPSAPGWNLLYIGIAPRNDLSPTTIRSRVLTQHLGGSTGSSTFRLSLAALLIDTLAFHPVRRKNDFVLPRAENVKLSEWQREHLRLTWVAQPAPWTIEPLVIAALNPPLNLDHNSAHPFHRTMTAARARFRAAAGAGRPGGAET
jgi:hypothetical protein